MIKIKILDDCLEESVYVFNKRRQINQSDHLLTESKTKKKDDGCKG